jgi:hypothetical protein
MTQSIDITISLTFLRSVPISDSNDDVRLNDAHPSTLVTSLKDASYLGELSFYFLRPKIQRYINKSPAND